MVKIKLTVLPYYLGKLFKQGDLVVDDLKDESKLLSILSKNCVDKYRYLNNLKSAVRDVDSGNFIRLMNLNWLVAYTGTQYTPGRGSYVGSVLEALSEDGLEDNVSSIIPLLHTLSLDFEFVKVDVKEYVIILNELTEVDKPLDRVTDVLISMESLLAALSEDLSDELIINEPLYTHYLAIKANNL